MSFELKECRLGEIAPHPRLPGRVQAVVSVSLREELGVIVNHNLAIKVWADIDDAMTDQDIQSALMAKAAVIINRTIATVTVPPLLRAAE